MRDRSQALVESGCLKHCPDSSEAEEEKGNVI
jgi:hypothetical protein